MKVKKEEIAKALRIGANFGGGAGARLGVKVSKTDLILPKILPAGWTGAAAAAWVAA